MKKVDIIIIAVLMIFYSCSTNNNSEVKEAFLDRDIIDVLIDESELSAEAYNLAAQKILQHHKPHLKTVLPNIIFEQTQLIRNTIQEIEKSRVASVGFSQTLELIHLEKEKTAIKLYEKEIDLNSEYFALLHDLDLLNKKYESLLLPGQNYISYFESGPIVLAEEVSFKISELIDDNDIRSISQRRQRNIDRAMLVTYFVPGVSQFGPALNALSKQSAMFAPVIKLASSGSSSSFIRTYLTNNSPKIIYGSYKYNNNSEDNHSSLIESSILERDFFKIIDNKIEGRIGDFSDGILAVHFQNIRDLIKENESRINSKLINIK